MADRVLALTAGLLALSLTASGAAQSAPAVKKAPVAVELFSSQSCSSCVGAAAFMVELAGREDVVALSWHVDYWNALQTRHGRWVDPYSDESSTERQRAYNAALRQTRSVFTPQMVVNGAAQIVGSQRQGVLALIADAAPSSARLAASRRGGELAVAVDGAPRNAEALLVTFMPRAATEVPRGENAGVVYRDANIVTGAQRLGAISSDHMEFHAPAPGDGEHCAILLQEPGQGRILAAAYCAGQ